MKDFLFEFVTWTRVDDLLKNVQIGGSKTADSETNVSNKLPVVLHT